MGTHKSQTRGRAALLVQEEAPCTGPWSILGPPRLQTPQGEGHRPQAAAGQDGPRTLEAGGLAGRVSVTPALKAEALGLGPGALCLCGPGAPLTLPAGSCPPPHQVSMTPLCPPVMNAILDWEHNLYWLLEKQVHVRQIHALFPGDVMVLP